MTIIEFKTYIEELEKIVKEDTPGASMANFFLFSDMNYRSIEEMENFLDFYNRNR